MLLSLGLACIAVLGFGSSAVLARLGMQAMRPMPSALVSMVASTLLASALALIFELDAIIAMPAIAMVWLLGNGMLSYIGGRSQQYIAISLIGAARVTPIVGSAALFSALFSVTLTRMGVPGFNEHLNVLLGVGTVVVVIGLGLTGGNFLRQSWGSDWKSVLGYLLALLAAACYGASTSQRTGPERDVRLAADHGGGQHVLRHAAAVAGVRPGSGAEDGFHGLGAAVGLPGGMLGRVRGDLALLRRDPGGFQHTGHRAHRILQPAVHAADGAPLPAPERNGHERAGYRHATGPWAAWYGGGWGACGIACRIIGQARLRGEP